VTAAGTIRDFNHPLNAVMQKTQQKAKQVMATVTFKNIITSDKKSNISQDNYMGKDAGTRTDHLFFFSWQQA
jgi:hypothetical protein